MLFFLFLRPILLLVVMASGLSIAYQHLPLKKYPAAQLKQALEPDLQNPLTVLDRHNIELARLYPKYGGHYQPVQYQDLTPAIIEAVVATEDKRFWQHPGWDWQALVRAILQNFRKGHVVSGGSTITQQLGRLAFELPRTYLFKFQEIYLAYQLEQHLSKKQILAAYLNRAWFGNHCYGIGAAARMYLDKSVDQLSYSESAFLIGLLKSGIHYDPYTKPAAAEKRRRYVLSRLQAEGYLPANSYDLACAEKIDLRPWRLPFKAPHFCFYIKKKLIEAGWDNIAQVKTTLDYQLQQKINKLFKNYLQTLKGFNVNNGAIVVLKSNGELLTMIGSADYFDKNHHGQVNGALALRQPGSALKPFLYAYIFGKGHGPTSIIADLPTSIPTVSGDYRPLNFDCKYHGPVSIREALACSYNVPAVKWLFKYDPAEYVQFLQTMGLTSINQSPHHYGLGIALGSAEVTLKELARSYTVLANLGTYAYTSPIISLKGNGPRNYRAPTCQKEVLGPDISYLINHILTDRNMRQKAFPSNRGVIYPLDIAYKTGTSKDYRDAWVIGYDKSYIVGIWLGNFRGQPMKQITGGNGAVPLLYDIFLHLNPNQENRLWQRPPNITSCQICPLSGKKQGPFCPHAVTGFFRQENKPQQSCQVHQQFAQRQAPAIKKVFAVLPPKYQAWCRENNWELPSFAWRPVNPQTAPDQQQVQIAHPDNKDIFAIDPHLPLSYQKIRLQAVSPQATKYLRWYINDNFWKQVSTEQTCSWQLQPGKYKIKVKAILNNGQILPSKPVKILVQ